MELNIWYNTIVYLKMRKSSCSVICSLIKYTLRGDVEFPVLILDRIRIIGKVRRTGGQQLLNCQEITEQKYSQKNGERFHKKFDKLQKYNRKSLNEIPV